MRSRSRIFYFFFLSFSALFFIRLVSGVSVGEEHINSPRSPGRVSAVDNEFTSAFETLVQSVEPRNITNHITMISLSKAVQAANSNAVGFWPLHVNGHAQFMYITDTKGNIFTYGRPSKSSSAFIDVYNPGISEITAMSSGVREYDDHVLFVVAGEGVLSTHVAHFDLRAKSSEGVAMKVKKEYQNTVAVPVTDIATFQRGLIARHFIVTLDTQGDIIMYSRNLTPLQRFEVGATLISRAAGLLFYARKEHLHAIDTHTMSISYVSCSLKSPVYSLSVHPFAPAIAMVTDHSNRVLLFDARNSPDPISFVSLPEEDADVASYLVALSGMTAVVSKHTLIAFNSTDALHVSDEFLSVTPLRELESEDTSAVSSSPVNLRSVVSNRLRSFLVLTDTSLVWLEHSLKVEDPLRSISPWTSPSYLLLVGIGIAILYQCARRSFTSTPPKLPPKSGSSHPHTHEDTGASTRAQEERMLRDMQLRRKQADRYRRQSIRWDDQFQ